MQISDHLLKTQNVVSSSKFENENKNSKTIKFDGMFDDLKVYSQFNSSNITSWVVLPQFQSLFPKKDVVQK